MTVSRPALVLVMTMAVVAGAWLAAYGPSHAQEGQPGRATGNVSDAMLQPLRLPFNEGKSLEEVAAYLRKELRANVILDLAALDRHQLKPTNHVRIDLDGVRLKTGLKLLLDQVGLTTRVIPEDNLLIITDKAESDEPIDRLREEVKALHRDLHTLQDDVREIRDILTVPVEEEPVARRGTRRSSRRCRRRRRRRRRTTPSRSRRGPAPGSDPPGGPVRMPGLAIALALTLVLADEPAPANPSTPTRRPAPRAEPERWGWLTDPRSAVLLTLGAAAVLGGGRKLLHGMQARKAHSRLAEADVTPAEIADSARFGREGLIDLFRLLETAPDADRREAAGRALASLWKRDELVAEEEKAIVRRGFSATWRARRRYPRDLAAAIPIRVEYGVPFLREAAGEVGPGDLAWSHRITGAERASLEEFSPWTKGVGVATFSIDPADFTGSGSHRLVLQARVRTEGLSDRWDLELPHIPFTFELDPQLRVEALLAPRDEGREAALRGAVSLRTASPAAEESPRFVPLNDDLVLRDPPSLVVTVPLPCDLAHGVFVEFEGVPGRFAAGEAVVIGQGRDPRHDLPGAALAAPAGRHRASGRDPPPRDPRGRPPPRLGRPRRPLPLAGHDRHRLGGCACRPPVSLTASSHTPRYSPRSSRRSRACSPCSRSRRGAPGHIRGRISNR